MRVERGKIVAVGTDVRPVSGDEIVEADGLTLLPGFVDIHSHGRGGADFSNAMMPIHHLRPTMVTGGLLADDVLAEIITDGVHLSDPMIKLIAKAKGPDRVMIITDAMCAAGEPGRRRV